MPRDHSVIGGLVRRSSRYIFVSLGLLLPCFWESRVQASDVSSHLYNAWLVQEINAGKLPGLSTVWQPTNILFDYLLDFLAVRCGWLVADRLALAASVLVFFWGAFAFIWRCNGHAPWLVTPWLAVFAYGIVFRMGFANFYLAVGLSLFALAVLGASDARFRLWALPVAVFACTAHAAPVLWAGIIAFYSYIQARLHDRWKLVFPAAAMVALIGGILLVRSIYPSLWFPEQVLEPMGIVGLFGLDQVWIYGPKYLLLAFGFLALVIAMLLRKADQYGLHGFVRDARSQLMCFHVAAYATVPLSIQLPLHDVPFAYVSIRVSLLTAILMCLVYASAKISRIEFAAACVLAVLFFSFTYADEAAMNRLEDRVDDIVASLPRGSRVVGLLRAQRSSTPALLHVVDRACIGRCFSYANYEAATKVFRVRAEPRNPYVLDKVEDLRRISRGTFMVQPYQAPIYEIYSCGEPEQVCVEQRAVGERLAGTAVDVMPTWW